MKTNKYIQRITLTIYLFFALANFFTANIMAIFPVHNNISIIIGNIFRYLASSAFIFIPIAFLFNDKRANFIVSYFLIPLVILNLIFSHDLINIHEMSYYELLTYYLSKIMTILCSIYCIFSNQMKKEFDYKVIIYFLAVVLLLFPCNFFMRYNWINNNMLKFKLFHLWHFVFLGLFIIVTILVYYILKNKDKENVKLILFTLSLICFYHFMGRFSYVRLTPYQDIFDIFGALPFYICSFGICILPLVIYSENKALMSISYLINMPGAIIVLVNPSTGPVSILHYDSLYFFLTHILLFSITFQLPIHYKLEMNLKTIRNVSIFLACYFIVMLFLNIMITPKIGYDPNYSFVSKAPIPVELPQIFILHYKGFDISFLYLFLLWLVHVALALFTFFAYKYIKKERILI